MNSNLIIAISFFITGLLLIIRNVKSKEYVNFLWFCDVAPFLFGLGFLFSDVQFVKAVISIGLLGQIFTLFRVGEKRFKEWKRSGKIYGKFYMFVEVLIHFTAVAAIILTYKVVPGLKSLEYSFIILIFMFILTFMLTTKKQNVNSLYDTGFDFGGDKNLELPFHTRLWILYAFLIIVLSNFGLQYVIYLIFH